MTHLRYLVWVLAALFVTGDAARIDADDSRQHGGLLFANFCQVSGAMLVCTPATLSVPRRNGGVARVATLPEVSQPIDLSVTPPDAARMHGATIDVRRGLVFWQAGCTPRFYTTDIRTGVTTEFPIDLAGLGISTGDGGVCLNEWIFDDVRDSAIVLGGVPVDTGHGLVQLVFEVRHDGTISVLRDLRPALDVERLFIHPFQSIISFDPVRREILTGGTLAVGAPDPQRQQRLRLALEDGDVARSEGGFSVQAQFFDRVLDRHLFWNCALPGISDEASFVIQLSEEDLRANNHQSTTELCYQGFLGGAHDPETERFLVLARRGQVVDTSETLSLGILDIRHQRFVRWIDTDATYEMFRVTAESGSNLGVIPGKTFFFSVMFAPATRTIDTDAETAGRGVVREDR